MSDTPFEENYEQDDGDLGLSAEDRAKANTARQPWYKAEKGRVDRVALVYFNTLSMSAVRRLEAVLRKDGKPAPTAEIRKAAARQVLEKRAKDLGKSVDQLSKVEVLDLNDVRFKSYMAHYQEGMGYIISRLGMDGAEADAIWRRLPEAQRHFVTLLLVYPTKGDEGDVDIEAMAAGKWRLLPWRFGPAKYERIYKLNSSFLKDGFPIASRDLTIECKDAQYQNLDINGAGPAFYRHEKAEKIKQAILARAVAMYDDLNPFREMTTNDLKIKLGLGGGGSMDVNMEDFQGLMENIT